MRNTGFCLLLIFVSVQSYAQKPIIDTGVFNKWPVVTAPLNSPDNTFSVYTIENFAPNSSSLMIHKTYKSWQLRIDAIVSSFYQFTDDSHFLIFKKVNDSLGVLDLKKLKFNYIASVVTYNVLKSGKRQLILCHLRDKSILMYDLHTGLHSRYPDVIEYLVSGNGERIFLKVRKDNRYAILLLNKSGDSLKTVWSGTEPLNWVTTVSGRQLAFLSTIDHAGPDEYVIRYYREDTDSVLTLSWRNEDKQNFVLKDLLGFSSDGEQLFCNVVINAPKPKKTSNVGVNVWSYRDYKLQSQQLAELSRMTYVVSFDIGTSRLIQLQQEYERIQLSPGQRSDTVALITIQKGDNSEAGWNSLSIPESFYISTKTGHRRPVGIMLDRSPGGKYDIGYDHTRKIFLIKDVRDQSEFVLSDCFIKHQGKENIEFINLKVLCWLPKDSIVMVSDNYDIWSVDPTGVVLPINLTNAYGKMHNITFSISYHQIYDWVLQDPSKSIILLAEDHNNEENGFYKMKLNKAKNPERLLMEQAYISHSPYNFSENGRFWDKTKNNEAHLVLKGNSKTSVNCFVTKDFKTLTPLSDIYPERSYNWLTSELIHYNTLDGLPSKAVVYKPEDFDAGKKYPVIFYYYQTMSVDINTYRQPAPCDGGLNIPWFVSHGYIVCTPDILTKQGMPGESAYSSVLGASNYMEQCAWVDKERMGLYGHSFGGFETNYIITHSNKFAAAYSGAGPSNLISAYGTVFKGMSYSYIPEYAQLSMFTNLWENTPGYIDNSPVLSADKVQTPVLLMHNLQDNSVPFAQGMEFFTALRRLNKKSWLLDYDDEGHTLGNWQNQMDFTLRLTQFFNHYLKNAAPPKWMTEGIPAYLKQVTAGLELDTTNIKP